MAHFYEDRLGNTERVWKNIRRLKKPSLQEAMSKQMIQIWQQTKCIALLKNNIKPNIKTRNILFIGIK